MAIIRHGYSDGSERRERSKLYNSSAWKKASKIVMVRAERSVQVVRPRGHRRGASHRVDA